MLEYEKKILLTYKEYQMLMAIFNDNAKSVVQRNYYYDTDDFSMNKQGITCRIREKNGIYTATVKKHNWNGLDCSFEKSETVLDEYDTNAFSDMNVRFQGYLETHRNVLYSDNDLEIVLDRNTYLGIEDYELEIEYSKGKKDYAEFKLRYMAYKLRDMDSTFDVLKFCNRTQTVMNKSERFFEMLKKIKSML